LQAAVYRRYGAPEVVHIQEVPDLTPKADELLVKVVATTVTSADWRVRSLQAPAGFGAMVRLVFGITRPRQPVLGTEFAGVVQAVGARVRNFAVGDQVFGNTGARMGCHAQYVCISHDAAVAHKPHNVPFAQAAALSFGGTTALDFFRRGKLKRGETLLINGASGAVGTAAVQLARHAGAHVTAVCSGANAALVKSLGADAVIDYTQEDFTTNGQTYDVVMDNAGTAPYARCKNSLAPTGRLLLVLADLPSMLAGMYVPLLSKHRVVAGPASARAEDLHELTRLAQAGVFTPVIDRSFAFTQIVDAHRYVDAGRKRGNVMINVSEA
jgi:NADPH:quinone reductase-like Zn-dependent oxidoreductase